MQTIHTVTALVCGTRVRLRHAVALLAMVVGCLLQASLFAPAYAALTAEEATRVGGDLTGIGKDLGTLNQRTAALQAAVRKIADAAPSVLAELEKARQKIAAGRGDGELADNAAKGFGVMLGLLLLSLGFRRLTRRWRLACIRSEVRARGAAGLAALDLGQWAVFAIGAYLAIKFYFDSDDPQALLLVAILSALVRWFLFLKFIGIALRPRLSAFRLIGMSDRAARHARIWFAAGTLCGFLGIAVMPLLLRVGLPIAVGQFLVLVQGVVVAIACAMGVWSYWVAHPVRERSQRVWLWSSWLGIALILVLWTGGVLTLEFAPYHSLAYTLRIALWAYVIHAIFDLSAGAYGWYRLVQHATSAGAVLALSIILSELWLVERLALIPMAVWLPIRYSLETTAITLFVGFVAWRYLDMWTERRLRAASPGLAPGIDDDIAAEPASRLTTLLPLVRVSVGVAILILVAFLGLSQLGADLTTLLAGAGVFGLAISFGSQALVRDIVSGIFFMSDDAFRVGEYIDTGRLKGTVERVTMRSVRLRHQNGQIHTIPFGQLSAITNFSRDWQTVKFNLRLARDADLEKTRKTVKRVGQEMLEDSELGKEFLLPLKLQGMAEITDSALVVRLKFTVRPSNPSVVQREALKRLHRAFAQDGIEFAAGVITVQPAGVPALAAVHGAAAVSAVAPAAASADGVA